MKVYTVILAGGTGSRMNSTVNKSLLLLHGKTVIRRSVEAFAGLTDAMVVVCNTDFMNDLAAEAEKANLAVPLQFVDGGKTRQESVLKGLLSCQFENDDIVLIHDAARCLVTSDIIRNVVSSLKESCCAVPGIPATSTYKISNDLGFVVQTPDRKHLYEIQTPQGFHARSLLSVSVRASENGYEGTDDASLMEHYGYPVRIVPGSVRNIKMTTQDDLITAETLLKGGRRSVRTGMGYDVHRLVEGRKLILCGVEIPWTYGLLGHSDADVALHALIDAILGACGMGDIGSHYPDSDEQFRNISSLYLLKDTNRIIREAGFRVFNADITIVAQKPKILPFIPGMVRNVAEALGMEESYVNVKATTTEHLGFEGREEGISAYAVCVVEQ